jgi:hypothetical protein
MALRYRFARCCRMLPVKQKNFAWGWRNSPSNLNVGKIAKIPSKNFEIAKIPGTILKLLK